MAKNSSDVKKALDLLYFQIKQIKDADKKLGEVITDEITKNLEKYLQGMMKRLKLTDKTLVEQQKIIKKIQVHSESSVAVLKKVTESFEKAVIANKAAFQKLNESGKLAKIFQSDELVEEQAAKLDKSGLFNSIKLKWIKKEGDQGILSYRKRNLSVKGKPNPLTEAITNEESSEPKRSVFSSISDTLYKGILKLLSMIEKNTRSKSNKSDKSSKAYNKPSISSEALVGNPNRQKSKRKKKAVDENEEDTRSKAKKEYDDLNYKSFEGTIFDTVQRNSDPSTQLAMQIVKHQYLLYKKRKSDKAKKLEIEKNEEKGLTQGTSQAEKDNSTRRISQEQVKNDVVNTPQASGEPESKVKFDLATVKSERIKDDPSSNLTTTSTDDGNGILGTIASTLSAIAPALKGLTKGIAEVAMLAARALGPAAAVAGSAYAGYKIGDWLRNTSIGDSLGLSDKAIKENRSLMGSWTKEDEDAGKLSPETLAIIAKKKARAAELKTQQKKTDMAKKQDVVTPQVTTINYPKTTTNVVSGSNISSGKGIGTRNPDSSFIRYLDSRTNFS